MPENVSRILLRLISGLFCRIQSPMHYLAQEQYESKSISLQVGLQLAGIPSLLAPIMIQ
jgi:uncharacterized membrane protein YczE